MSGMSIVDSVNYQPTAPVHGVLAAFTAVSNTVFKISAYAFVVFAALAAALEDYGELFDRTLSWAYWSLGTAGIAAVATIILSSIAIAKFGLQRSSDSGASTSS